VDYIWMEGWGASSPGHVRRLLILVLGGIVGVIFRLRTQWMPNVGSQSPKALTPNTKMGKCQG
jgi:hypothetical protein